MTHCLKLNRLIALSKAWSVSEALWILQVYKCDRDELCWRNSWTTPYALGMATDGAYPASEILVKFLGGPTGGWEYAGPLSMYVIDRVLEDWKLNKTSWAWLLQFNSDTTTHISVQLKHVVPGERQQLLPGFNNEAGGYEAVPFDTITEYVQVGMNTYTAQQNKGAQTIYGCRE